MTLIVDKSAAPAAVASDSDSAGPSRSSTPSGSNGWVKSSSRSGNKSLMNPDTYAKT